MCLLPMLYVPPSIPRYRTMFIEHSALYLNFLYYKIGFKILYLSTLALHIFATGNRSATWNQSASVDAPEFRVRSGRSEARRAPSRRGHPREQTDHEGLLLHERPRASTGAQREPPIGLLRCAQRRGARLACQRHYRRRRREQWPLAAPFSGWRGGVNFVGRRQRRRRQRLSLTPLQGKSGPRLSIPDQGVGVLV